MQSKRSTIRGRGPFIVACSECGARLARYPSQLAHRPDPTCSISCRVAKRTRLAFERNARPCVICGRVFYDTPGSFAKEGRKACSMKCRSQWQRDGSPEDAEERFWRRVVKSDGCWLRSGGRLNGGYICFRDGERSINSSRYAWILATGETLARSDFICHVCDTPACVRNDEVGTYKVNGVVYPRRGHLFKANVAANSADMANKGRASHAGGSSPGSHNPRAKLTERDVRAIRAAVGAGVHPATLATRYGLTDTSIRFIVQRKTWRHLE